EDRRGEMCRHSSRLEILDLVMGGLLVLDQALLLWERRPAHRAFVRFYRSLVRHLHPLVLHLMVFPEVFLVREIRSAVLASRHALARQTLHVFFFLAHISGKLSFSD